MTENPLRLISVAGIVFRTVSVVVRMKLLYLNPPITASSKNLSRGPILRVGNTTSLLPCLECRGIFFLPLFLLAEPVLNRREFFLSVFSGLNQLRG